jgi:2-phosphoglycerate kinase
MKKLLIIAGNLAALKTTISKKISERLNIPCINKDDIKELLVDAIDFKTREENLKLSQATFQLIKYFCDRCGKAGKDLIIESNFKPHEIKELLDYISIDLANVKMIFLTGNPESLYERYLARQETRHRAHKSTGLISYDNFKKSQLSAQDFRFKEILEIDTTAFTDEDLENLVLIIEEFFC